MCYFIDKLCKDMCTFSMQCIQSGSLLRLRSITLSMSVQTSNDILKWLQRVQALLSSSPIEVFQVYSTFSYFDAGSMVAMNEFCSKIVTTHGCRLTRFSVHRIRIGIDIILDICLRCVALEQLFVVVHSQDLVSACACVIADLITRKHVRLYLLRVWQKRTNFEQCILITLQRIAAKRAPVLPSYRRTRHYVSFDSLDQLSPSLAAMLGYGRYVHTFLFLYDNSFRFSVVSVGQSGGCRRRVGPDYDRAKTLIL
jgi:hypothetical protein